MTKVKGLVYSGAAIIGIFAFFLFTRDPSVPEIENTQSINSESDLDRQPSATQKAEKPEPAVPTLHQSLLGNDQILEIQERVDESGKVRQVALIKRSRFKYPLLISEIVLDSSGNVLSRNEKVADHLMVKLKNASEKNAFERDLENLGARIRQIQENSGIYLVQFESTSIGALGKMKESILNTGKVTYAEEDRIVHLPRQPARGF